MFVKVETVYFKVYPAVVLSGTEATIRIRPLYDHCKFDESKEYEIVQIPMAINGFQCKRYSARLRPEDGILNFVCVFEEEQEHKLEVSVLTDSGKKHVGTFDIYSVEKDIYERRPFKGDMHMHSWCSDGKEAPAYVAAACRRIGLDFMAVTDHGKYGPSIEAQEAFKSVDIGLRIYRGEEVHPPENAVHMINFGGSFSVNEFFDKEEYFDGIKTLDETTGDLPTNVNRYQYLSCVWCFTKIREAGGLGIFCHPYWVYRYVYDVSSGLTEYMFENQPFDALELLGGYPLSEVDSNTLQIACYNEQRSKGKKIPIVGVSDAHGCETDELFGWYYTIVFAESLELPEIIGSIKDLYSVAVEAIPGQPVRVYGPLRLVKYALFLLKTVFPEHDSNCFLEGKLMLHYLSGEQNAADRIKELKTRNSKALNAYWA